MNILIVDDDAVIKRWLSMLLTQLEAYEKTIFEAADGLEALEICRKQTIDLVISDIMMPQMNGLELLQNLKVQSPHTRLAVLSSYDDFEYVRKALKMGALDYIPKADMTIQDISTLLDKTLRSFERENALASASSSESDVYSKRMRAFQAYLENPVRELFPFAGKDDPSAASSDICIAIFRLQKQQDAYASYVLNICENLLKSERLSGLCFPWRDHLLVAVYSCSHSIGEYQQEEFLKLFTTLDQDMEKYAHLSIDLCINVFCRKGRQIRSSFFQGVDALQKKAYYGLPQMPALESAVVSDSVSLQKVWLNMLEQLLDKGEYQTALQRVRDYVEECHQNLVAPFVVKKNCSIALYVLIANALLISSNDYILHTLENMDEKLRAVENRQQMENWVAELCDKIQEHIHAGPQRFSPAIRSAILYINENYHRKIFLSDIAKAVFMNHTYLSQQFKKEVGLSIPKYLEQVRINKALLLLRSSDYSISEIAEQVGFSNQNYFSKVFKNATGRSPMKFKKN